MTAPLYRRLLGADFDRLPGIVRRLHDLDGPAVWSGMADVERGTSPAALVLAGLLGMPPAGRGQNLTVTFTPRGDDEIWERKFGASLFRTRQSLRDGLLIEQAGPASLAMQPQVSEKGLALGLKGVTMLGIGAPAFLVPDIVTLESEIDGRYSFEVEARPDAPGVGRLIRYAGWLEPHAA
jgi:hypothetical protein